MEGKEKQDKQGPRTEKAPFQWYPCLVLISIELQPEKRRETGSSGANNKGGAEEAVPEL